MRYRLLAALVSIFGSAAAAPAVDFYTTQYVASGANTFSAPATGSHLAAVLFIWNDTGGITTPTYAGVNMIAVASHASTNPFGASTLSVYVLGGVSARTNTVSFSSSGQSIAALITVSGAATLQPDAAATFVTGTTGSAPTFEAPLPVTTTVNGSLVLGVFGSNNHLSVAPSTTGTFVGQDSFLSFFYWSSTAPVASAGAFTLKAQGNGAGIAYDGIGLAVAPFTSSAAPMVPRIGANL